MNLMPQSLKVAIRNCGSGRPSATQHCDEVLAQVVNFIEGPPHGVHQLVDYQDGSTLSDNGVSTANYPSPGANNAGVE